MDAAAEMHVVVDAKRRLMLLRFGITTDGATYLDTMQRWLHRTPEAVEYDWLYDLRIYQGTVSHGDVKAFAAAYEKVAQGRDAGARSLFVTTDPGFPLWARACALSFSQRRLVVVKSMAEAEEALRRDF
jgi:hypothetical protein